MRCLQTCYPNHIRLSHTCSPSDSLRLRYRPRKSILGGHQERLANAYPVEPTVFALCLPT